MDHLMPEYIALECYGRIRRMQKGSLLRRGDGLRGYGTVQFVRYAFGSIRGHHFQRIKDHTASCRRKKQS